MAHPDPHEAPDSVIPLCVASHERLLATIAAIDDETARRPALLPEWTVGHVLTHLARNADSHTRRLEGALRGEDVDRYPGGTEQRDREIDEGAGRPGKALAGDVAESCRRLEDAWRECERAGWPDPRDPGSGKRPANESPLYRRREVEIHHADLGLGYTPADWPQDYAEWELRHSLGQLPGRIPDSRDRLRFLTWLLGRSDFPADLKLTAS